MGDGGQGVRLPFRARALWWRYEALYCFEIAGDSCGRGGGWRSCIRGLAACERVYSLRPDEIIRSMRIVGVFRVTNLLAKHRVNNHSLSADEIKRLYNIGR